MTTMIAVFEARTALAKAKSAQRVVSRKKETRGSGR
jgi:hypothetical protein